MPLNTSASTGWRKNTCALILLWASVFHRPRAVILSGVDTNLYTSLLLPQCKHDFFMN